MSETPSKSDAINQFEVSISRIGLGNSFNVIHIKGDMACKDVFHVSSWKSNTSQCTRFILSQIYNHEVSIVTTGVKEISPDITEPLHGSQVYHVSGLPVSLLLSKEFVGAFTTSGTFRMLSDGRNMYCEDCSALLPSGKLILNVTKATYLKLGLEGEPADGKKKKALRYVIEIDTLDVVSKPKIHARTLECLQKYCALRMDFIFSWTPHDKDICSSSVQRYLLSKGHNCVLTPPDISYTVCEIPCPLVTEDKYTPEACGDVSCDFSEVYDWLGAVSCGAAISGGDLSAFSDLSASQLETCVSYSVSGLVSPELTLDTFHSLCKLSESSGRVVYLSVDSFPDNPTRSHDRLPTTSHTQTELYTYVLFPSGQCWVHKVYSDTC